MFPHILVMCVQPAACYSVLLRRMSFPEAAAAAAAAPRAPLSGGEGARCRPPPRTALIAGSVLTPPSVLTMGVAATVTGNAAGKAAGAESKSSKDLPRPDSVLAIC